MDILQRYLIAGLAVLSVGVGFFIFLTQPRQFDETVLPEREIDLVNGEQMFWIGGCGSCHAAAGAKGDDKLILSGGLALETPFGTFRAPNISPDKVAGIGSWSTIEFVNALVKGVSPAGEHYYPAFPYSNYQRMPFEDLIDLKAFLDQLPKSSKRNIDHELGFPFNIRRGLGLWKKFYLDGQSFLYTQTRMDAELRGRYLVEGPGHCGACHTPRDVFGGKISSKKLAGAPSLEVLPGKKAGTIPNITPHQDGIEAWTTRDIAYGLKTGFKPDFDSFGGSMVSVQDNLEHLSDQDHEAIATYLKSVPAVASNKK